jgi:hypothetical protein
MRELFLLVVVRDEGAGGRGDGRQPEAHNEEAQKGVDLAEGNPRLNVELGQGTLAGQELAQERGLQGQTEG